MKTEIKQGVSKFTEKDLTPITLIEIKNQLAIENGFESWHDWKTQSKEITGHGNIPEGFMDRVAELYAKSKGPLETHVQTELEKIQAGHEGYKVVPVELWREIIGHVICAKESYRVINATMLANESESLYNKIKSL